MNLYLALVSLFVSVTLKAYGFNLEEINSFYDTFLCEERNELASFGLNSGCETPPTPSPLPPPPIPSPPSGTVPIGPQKGHFPVIIKNDSGVDPSKVFILASNPPIKGGSDGHLFNLVKQPGIMKACPLTANGVAVFASAYSIPLSMLPKANTGNNDYLLYFPFFQESVRVYISFDQKLFLSITPDPGLNNRYALNGPTQVFNNPNFNVIYDFVELTLSKVVSPENPKLPIQPFMDTTQVDSFGTPIKLEFCKYDQSTGKDELFTQKNIIATSPAGFELSRTSLIRSIMDDFKMFSSTWKQLAIPFNSNPYSPGMEEIILRVLSPKLSVGGSSGVVPQPEGGEYTIPHFPKDFLVNSVYGKGENTIIDNLYAYYEAVSLYIEVEDGSEKVYKGDVTGSKGSREFAFVSGTDTVVIKESDFVSSTDSTNSAPGINALYSGVTPIDAAKSTAPGSDQAAIARLFSAAFATGLLGGSVFETQDTPLNQLNLQKHIYGENPWTSGRPPSVHTIPILYKYDFFGAGASPSHSVYSEILHKYGVAGITPSYPATASTGQAEGYPQAGLVYSFDYDDSLGISSTVALNTTSGAELPKAPELLFARFTIQQVDTTELAIINNAVYEDETPNELTFTFGTPAGRLKYRQGTEGDFQDLPSDKKVSGVIATSSNPFQIEYSSSDGSKVVTAALFPKFQFVQPVNEFSTNEESVFPSILFIPTNTPTAPTSFEVLIPPF